MVAQDKDKTEEARRKREAEKVIKNSVPPSSINTTIKLHIAPVDKAAEARAAEEQRSKEIERWRAARDADTLIKGGAKPKEKETKSAPKPGKDEKKEERNKEKKDKKTTSIETGETAFGLVSGLNIDSSTIAEARQFPEKPVVGDTNKGPRKTELT